jgi:peptide/nickel transport system substrate-binding protein
VRRSPLLLLALAALISCSRAALPEGTLVILIQSPPETLDRRLALSAIAEHIAGNLIEPGLMKIGDDGRPLPDLAERLEVLDPTHFVATLRPGLVFQDGSPLTADDVVATFRSLTDGRLHSPLASKYQNLRSVEALDPLRVRFELREPYAPFAVDLVMGIVPASVATSAEPASFGRHPIGAGPFRLAAWPEDEWLLLEANPDYYGGRPPLGHLLFKTVRDETTRVLELLDGRADLAINQVSPPLLPMLEHAPGLKLLTGPGADAAYLMFQIDDPLVADLRVRQAIASAIDREAIVRYKFLGHARLGSSLLPPGNWARDDTLLPIPRDLPRARALLEEAGFSAAPPGRRLELTYKVSTDRFRKSVALAIAQQLGEAGIGVRVQTLEWGTFFTDVRRGNFELASLIWVPIIEPDLLFWVFASQSIPTPENGFNGANRGHYRNAEVDALLAEARRDGEEESRRRRYLEVQQKVAAELPYLVLWYEDQVAVLREDLEGFTLSPVGSLDSLAQAHRGTGRPDSGAVP